MACGQQHFKELFIVYPDEWLGSLPIYLKTIALVICRIITMCKFFVSNNITNLSILQKKTYFAQNGDEVSFALFPLILK